MRAPAVVTALSILVTLGACGSAPDTIDPSGVDELVIPAPTIDPSDFVDRIDNEFLPLQPGSRWTYRTGRGVEVVVSVLAETREVAGVAATVVRTDPPGRAAASEEWFAQDQRGNVWLLGRDGPGEGDWAAGVDGAEAGLAMPAEPRLGDGWVGGATRQGPDSILQVADVEATVASEYVAHDDALLIERTRNGQVEERFHVAGIGLVRAVSAGGSDLDLTDVRSG